MALRGADWSGFARGYNGPDYEHNRYAAKLAAYVAAHAVLTAQQSTHASAGWLNTARSAPVAKIPAVPADPADALNGAELATLAPTITQN